ncbi:MAG: hypothetical protein JNL08_19865 [Planctomycetes bacterium]|nr:hypothetical protein [Planctomycetota bacterium]
MDWHLLCVLHAVPTLFLTGLIWLVQLVHYPLFAAVGADQRVAFAREHQRRIGPLVVPPMLAEVLLTGWVWLAAPPAARGAAWLGAALLAVVWASTFLLQVPCHARLSRAADGAALRRLVATNWLRTVAWTGRAAVAVWLLAT